MEITYPQSLDAEKSVLGAVLVENSNWEFIADYTPDHFYSSTHREIFKAMSYCMEEGIPVDVLTVCQAPGFEGSPIEVSQLTDGIPKLVNCEFYAKIVAKKRNLRSQLKISQSLVKYLGSGGEDVVKAADLASRISDVSANVKSSKTETLNEVMDEVVAQITLQEAGEMDSSGFSNGIAALDKLVEFRRQKLYILAGRPSMGKTALALNQSVALCKQGLRGLIFEQEMSSVELGRRILSSEARIPYSALRDASATMQLALEERQRLVATQEYIRDNINLTLCDSPGQSIHDVNREVQRLKKAGTPVDFVVFDYIQLARLDGHNLVQATNNFTKTAKEIARAEDLIFIALSQLSRPGKDAYDNNGVPRMPRLDDLRDSGGLEQDADAVGFLHRPEFYLRQQGNDFSKWENVAVYSQAKNREGVVDAVQIGFHGELMTFSDPFWAQYGEDDGTECKDAVEAL